MSAETIGTAVLVVAGAALTVGPSKVTELRSGAPPITLDDLRSSGAPHLVLTTAPVSDHAARRAALDDLTALSDELGLYD